MGRKIGHLVSKETREKISETNKGKESPNKTNIHLICQVCKKKFRISPYRKDIAKFCSLGCYWKFLIGNNGYWFNKKRSPEDIEKFRKSHLGKTTSKKQKEMARLNWLGNKNPNWADGKSFEPYTIDWTETLKRSIRERDNYICQLCSQYGNVVHHKNYDKKNCCSENLITLCRKCNVKVNFNRKYWENYFNNKLKLCVHNG